MSLCRYKALLSYLPGMATVVNSFASPEVQTSVYRELMKALEARLEQEGYPPAGKTTDLKQLLSQSAATAREIEIEIEDGGSIHSLPSR